MRVVRIILIVGIVPLLAFLTAWGTLALWYRLPLDGAARIANAVRAVSHVPRRRCDGHAAARPTA